MSLHKYQCLLSNARLIYSSFGEYYFTIYVMIVDHLNMQYKYWCEYNMNIDCEYIMSIDGNYLKWHYSFIFINTLYL